MRLRLGLTIMAVAILISASLGVASAVYVSSLLTGTSSTIYLAAASHGTGMHNPGSSTGVNSPSHNSPVPNAKKLITNKGCMRSCMRGASTQGDADFCWYSCTN